MKKTLLLLIMLSVVAFACSANKAKSVSILTEQNQKSYAANEKSEYLAGSHLKTNNATCVDCHSEEGKLLDSEKEVNETCIGCHGDLKTMADVTKKDEVNPHSSHLGKVNCTACHGGHEPSALYCNNCHTFDIAISSSGDKKLLRNIDIAKYSNSSSSVIEKADVVVIGAGGAGLIAALNAKANGAKSVIVLEKMPISGGNSQLAAGGMNAAETTYQKEQSIPDTKKSMFKDTMKGGKNISNPELVLTLSEKSAESMQWLSAIGAKLDFISMGGGAEFKRFHAPSGGSAVGSYLVNIYKEMADKELIDLRLNSPAVKILTKDGGVYGVLVDGKHSGLYEIHAKSVILASGGFSANAERVISYRPDYKGMTTSNQPGATGDGLDLANTINAEFVDMKEIQIHPSIAVGSNTLITEAVRGVGAIMVNHDGKRFVNELETRDKVSAAILNEKGKTAYLILDDNIRKNLKQIEGYFHLKLAIEAKSIEGLAMKLNMPAISLKATIKEYNAGVAKQNDKFGKKTLPWKIEKPNFVAVEIAPGVHYTMGGVKINDKAQVISKDNKPIKNLYAAGEVTGGVHGANRLGGNSISETVTYGRIAGTEAAKNAK